MADSSRVSRAGAGWGGCRSGTARARWLESCGIRESAEASVNLPDVTSFVERAERLPWASAWLRRLAQNADEIAGTPFDERPQFSWIQPVNILQSRNDFIAHRARRLVDDQRRGWVKALGGPSKNGFVVDRSEDDAVSFLVVGDPGEGDVSQYALVRPIAARGEQTDFMFICSDVIYPAGSIDQYT